MNYLGFETLYYAYNLVFIKSARILNFVTPVP